MRKKKIYVCIDNPPNNFFELSLDKTDHVIQIGGWLLNEEIIHKIYRKGLRAFALRNYSEGYKINIPLSGLLKISQLPSKLCFSANGSYFGKSFSLGHYPPIYQPPKGVYTYIAYILK